MKEEKEYNNARHAYIEVAVDEHTGSSLVKEFCPKCQSLIAVNFIRQINNKDFNYCPYCGQKIKWKKQK